MYLIGIDEAGRGAWAGPLYASLAVIEEKKIHLLTRFGVKDSKKLTSKRRVDLCNIITEILDYYIIESVDVDLIDRLGVHEANKIIFQNLITKLPTDFLNSSVIYIDGNFSKLNLFYFDNGMKMNLKYKSIVDGDALMPQISAASILSKVYRDNFMVDISTKYSVYLFEIHKGYGTRLHRDLINKFGICDLHRKSFKPIQEYLTSKLFFS